VLSVPGSLSSLCTADSGAGQTIWPRRGVFCRVPQSDAELVNICVSPQEMAGQDDRTECGEAKSDKAENGVDEAKEDWADALGNEANDDVWLCVLLASGLRTVFGTHWTQLGPNHEGTGREQ